MAITFDSSFEGGNGVLQSIDENTSTVNVLTECDPAPALDWFAYNFYFKLTGVSGRYLTVKVDFAGDRGGGWWEDWNGRALWYSYDQVNWYKTPNGTYAGTVVTWNITPSQDVIYLSYHPSYTYSDLQDDIAVWDQSLYCTSSILTAGAFTTSQGGRNIYALTVDDPDSLQVKSHIFISCRPHPAEPQANWLLKGMMDWVLGSSPEAAALRATAVLHIVPMINPDGCYAGRVRAFNSGTDANRDFDTSGPDSVDEEQETFIIHTYLDNLQTTYGIDFAVDIHAAHSDYQRIYYDGVKNDLSLISKVEASVTNFDVAGFWETPWPTMDNNTDLVDTTYRHGYWAQYGISTIITEGMCHRDQNPTPSQMLEAGAATIWGVLDALSGVVSSAGVTWGVVSASPEQAAPWSEWKVEGSATDARDSGDAGRLLLLTGESFVGPVEDLGNSDQKTVTLSTNDYDSGSGSGTLYYRSRSTAFNYNDDEVTGPSWVQYTGPVSTTDRYFQPKVVA